MSLFGSIFRRDAMERAVPGWSPVIITGVIPAEKHCCTAAVTSSLGGSSNATIPSNIKSCSIVSSFSMAGNADKDRNARARTRYPFSAKSVACSRKTSLRISFSPSAVNCWRQRGKTFSGAPLVKAII